MKSKASAPGKVILFGEHFVVYGIKSILCAIDKRITVTAEKRKECQISIKSNIGCLESAPNKPISEIQDSLRPLYYIANKMIQKQNAGIEVVVKSDIPLGAGLGSSSACCVAGAAAISKLFCDLSKEDILKLAIEAEKTIFENTSGADCTVSTFGGIMEFSKKYGFKKIDHKLDFHMVIADSKMKHSTKTAVSKVNEFKNRNENKFTTLCEKESKLIEDVLKLLKNNDLNEIGKKITQNQEYLESIGVSNDKLREMIQTGKNESFGAKITGAGDGGCIFALTNETNLKQTINQFKDKKYDFFPVKIDYKGLDTF